MASASAMNAQADSEEEISKWNAARQREKAALAQAKGAQESRVKQEEGEAAASIGKIFADPDAATYGLNKEQIAAVKSWTPEKMGFEVDGTEK